MANRKPLVLGADGLPQQLQAGDTLDAPQSGGDQQVLTNADAAPIVIGAPVYMFGNDSFKAAQANAAATVKAIGLVAKSPSIANGAQGPVTISGVLTATTAEWDAITGAVGGLVKDTIYFLSAANPGRLVTAAPTVTGQYVVAVGVGLSTTEMKIMIGYPILL